MRTKSNPPQQAENSLKTDNACMTWMVIYQSDDLMVCQGIFSSLREAIGEMYLCVDELLDNSEKATGKISRMYRLEADSGYGITLTPETGDEKINLYALCWEGE